MPTPGAVTSGLTMSGRARFTTPRAELGHDVGVWRDLVYGSAANGGHVALNLLASQALMSITVRICDVDGRQDMGICQAMPQYLRG